MAHDKKIVFYLFAFFFLLFTLIMSGKINHKDGLGLYFITQSLVEKQAFDIPALPFASKQGLDGKYYSPFSIGMPIAAIPFYLIGKLFSNFTNNQFYKELIIKWSYTFFNVVCVSIMLVFFYKLHYLLFNNSRCSLISTLLLATATMFLHYSQTLFTEPFQALLLILTFYFYLCYQNTNKNSNLHLSAFFLGYNLFSKTLGFIYYIPFFLFFIFEYCKSKQLKEYLKIFKVFILYFFIFCVLLMIYNYYRFGNILDFGAADNRFLTELHNPFIAIMGFLFEKSKGIFITNPIFLLIFFSLLKSIKNKKYIILSFLIFLTALLIHSFFIYWPGAFCWGPRYLLPAFPFLFLVIDFEYIFQNKYLKILAIVIIAISIFIQILATSINSNSFLAFCFNNNLIYENTHDLPKISAIKGQVLLLYQNYLDFTNQRPIYINRISFKGVGEAQIWLFHIFRFFRNNSLIFIISLAIYTAIILIIIYILKKTIAFLQ